MSVIDEVKERTDIVELISSYVTLKKAGRNFKALCPFHQEKTPSFIVFPDQGRWHCFGACASGGDAFTFIMKKENMEFSETLRLLARRAGITLAPRSPQETVAEERKRLLAKINASAAQYFHHLLLNAAEGKKVRDYLQERGIERQAWEDFQLGYALEEWEELRHYLLERGYKDDDILATGLTLERESGGYYDRFRGRLIFPIRDIKGDAIGFGARALDASEPKYINSPDTPLFSKGSVLYGIDLAKEAIREKDTVVLVEGYTDVIMAHQKGHKNVVASMGTALTEAQLRTLKKLTKCYILALDADKAGEAAVQRGLEVAKEVLKGAVVPIPLGRHLINYESRLEAQIKIAILPEGKDPDDVLREDEKGWQRLVEGAQPVMDYYFSFVAFQYDLDSAKGKAKAARLLLPLIHELTSEVERGHYIQKLARLVRMDERRLLRELGSKRVPASHAQIVEGKKGILSTCPGYTFGVEKRLLHLLLEARSRLSIINEELERIDSGPLVAEDFDDVESREIYSAFLRFLPREAYSGDSPEGLDLERFAESLDESLKEEFAGLLALQADLSVLPSKEGDREAIICTLRMKESRLRRELETLHFLQKDAEEENDRDSLLQITGVAHERDMELLRISKARMDTNVMRRAPTSEFWDTSQWLES